MDRVKFEELVSVAVSELLDEFITKMENVSVLVQDWPTTDQLRRSGLRTTIWALRFFAYSEV